MIGTLGFGAVSTNPYLTEAQQREIWLRNKLLIDAAARRATTNAPAFVPLNLKDMSFTPVAQKDSTPWGMIAGGAFLLWLLSALSKDK